MSDQFCRLIQLFLSVGEIGFLGGLGDMSAEGIEATVPTNELGIILEVVEQ